MDKVERFYKNKALEELGGVSRSNSKNRELLLLCQQAVGFYY